MRWPTPERLAGLSAGVVATVGAAGWISAFPPGWDTDVWLAVGVALVVCMAAGALVHLLVTALIMRAMKPLRDIMSALHRSGEHRSDVISYLRGSSALDRATEAPPDAEALRRAVLICLRALEARQRRYEAWTVGVVHDLKAPLAACANAVGFVVSAPACEVIDRQELLREVEIELRKLSGELQRMVDVVRFSGDDVPMGVERVSLGAVLRRLLQQVPVRVVAQLTVSGSDEVLGDERLLERALGNLIHNAARNARSSISVEVLPGLVRIADDGGGLPASLDELTEPFRSEMTTTGAINVPAGAGGIGLFVARRVLEAHGGRLVVESTGSHGTVMLAYLGSGTRG